MSEHRVIAEPAAVQGELAISIDGKESGFELGTERLAAKLVANVPDRLMDLFEISAAVFAADSQIPRGEPTRAGMGAAWRRNFTFELAVREPEFWSRTDVNDALVEAIEFMSDDRPRFQFIEARQPAPLQSYFPLVHEEDAEAVDDVLLFSGGLDSLTGAVETLQDSRQRVALVTHLSAQKRMPVQRGLAEEMVAKFGRRALPIDVKARRRGGAEPPERTQRTRSLLFAAIGFLVRRMLGGSRLSFFENGVISQNLPISPQVIGTMATRTTHPLTFAKLNRLLALVADEPVQLRNPYEWLTKTEVLRRLHDRGAAGLISKTVSCSNVWEASVDQPHCGACSQCLDRRFAVLSEGLEAFDPAAGYQIDVMTGERPKEHDRTLGVDWTRHGKSLAAMPEKDFVDRFGSEVFAVARGFPEAPASKVLGKILDLHRRHGTQVTDALARATQMHARDLVAGVLPDTALLVMVHREGREVSSTERRSPTEILEPVEGDEAEPGQTTSNIFPLRVHVSKPRGTTLVEVEGIGSVRGKSGDVVRELKPAFDEDRADGREPEDHRYVKTGNIADRLGIAKQTVTVSAKRVRDDLADQYEVVVGRRPESGLLIETRKPHGYRLDPSCLYVRLVRSPDDA